MKLLPLVAFLLTTLAVNCRHLDGEENAVARDFLSIVKLPFQKIAFNKRNKKCIDKKKAGGVPSGVVDSPIDGYGFPNFNEKTKDSTVDPKTTLMLSNKVKQPIHIGSQDYIIQGNSQELLAFFECFEDYEVIGSELNADGKWPPNTGSIKIELQNVDTSSASAKGNIFEALFDMAMDNILKLLDPTGTVASLYEIEQALKPVMEYVPSPAEFAKKAKEIYVQKISKNEKKKRMLYWMKEQDKLTQLMWKKPGNINKGEKMIMSLTMYTRPLHTVRATYNTAKSTIKLGGISKILNLFFKS